MTTRRQADALVAGFGELVDLPDLSLDDAATCTLDIDEEGADLQIRFDRSRQRMALQARLRLSEVPSSQAMEAMLEHDASTSGRLDDVLALESSASPDLILHRFLDEVLDPQALAREVETVIADTLAWRDPPASDGAGESMPAKPDPTTRV